MNMPPITKNLIIINILFFLAQQILGMRYDLDLNDVLGLHFFLASDFHLYQLVTYMFMHGNFQHILFNMLAVWMFGRVMETMWGPKRFLLFYLICGIGAGLTQEVVQYISFMMNGLGSLPLDGLVSVDGYTMPLSTYLNFWTTVGASGAVYGILLAFGVTFPNERMFIFPLPVPHQGKVFRNRICCSGTFPGTGKPRRRSRSFCPLGRNDLCLDSDYVLAQKRRWQRLLRRLLFMGTAAAESAGSFPEDVFCKASDACFTRQNVRGYGL